MESFPYDSQVTYDAQGLPEYDRAANSTLLASVLAQYFTNGIFYNPTTAFTVIEDTDGGMYVKVNPGACQISGRVAIEKQIRKLTVQAADSQDRIDSVVLRLNLNTEIRTLDLYVLKGTPAVTPIAPALTRNSTVYELCLAELFIPTASTSITAQRITDTRLNEELCGIVAQTIGTLDTSPYFAQVQAMIDDLAAAIAGVIHGSSVMLKEEYDKNNSGVVDNAITKYTCITTGTTHALTGEGDNGKFIADAPFVSGDTITVNGTEYTIKIQGSTDLPDDDFWLAGDLVAFYLNGTTVNFKSGGGASLNFAFKTYATQAELEADTPSQNNTIGLVTSTSVGDYQFSATQPTTRSDGTALQNGDTWIGTAYNSSFSFNALPKNAIYIKLLAAYQYNGTSWTNISIELYQNSIWQKVYGGTLVFANGKWILYQQSNFTVGNEMVLTVTDGYLSLSGASGKYLINTLATNIGLYNKVRIVFTEIPNARIIFGFKTGSNIDSVVNVNLDSTITTNDVSLDVSAYASSSYFYILVYSAMNVKIDAIIFE